MINVKTMEDKKAKNKEKSKCEIKQEFQCRRMMAKVKVEDAKVKTRRSHVGGLFVVKINKFFKFVAIAL